MDIKIKKKILEIKKNDGLRLINEFPGGNSIDCARKCCRLSVDKKNYIVSLSTLAKIKINHTT